MKRLSDVLPREFMGVEYTDTPARKYADIVVVAEHHSHIRRWIGPQRYVMTWYVLANGKAVGWNENPSRGWSFPVIKFEE